jgi:hypothetical protein
LAFFSFLIFLSSPSLTEAHSWIFPKNTVMMYNKEAGSNLTMKKKTVLASWELRLNISQIGGGLVEYSHHEQK